MVTVWPAFSRMAQIPRHFILYDKSDLLNSQLNVTQLLSLCKVFLKTKFVSQNKDLCQTMRFSFLRGPHSTCINVTHVEWAVL